MAREHIEGENHDLMELFSSSEPRSALVLMCNLMQIFHKNVAHPKLAEFIKKHNWVNESGEYLIFHTNQSEYRKGVLHYLEFIEEVSMWSLILLILCDCLICFLLLA